MSTLPRGRASQALGKPIQATSGPVAVGLQPSSFQITSSTLPTGASTDASLLSPQAAAGSNATTAMSVQGITGGKAVPISAASLPLPTGAALDSSLGTIITNLGSPLQQTGGTVKITTAAVTLTHTNITTSNASQQALAANSSAKYRLFQNIDATNSLVISFGVAAVVNTQIVLFPKDKLEFSLTEGNLDTRAVNCIANAGTPVLLITEGV